MQDEKLTRYIVTVPAGVRISEALARHREETGHGGTCILRFADLEDHLPARSRSEVLLPMGRAMHAV
jgi:hypothetical protein